MAVKHIDYLKPIENKRDEYFIIDFNNSIKSINESILLHILDHREDYEEIFPKIFEMELFKNTSDLFTYSITKKLEDIFIEISGNEKFYDEYDFDILYKSFRELDTVNYNKSKITRIGKAIPHLVTQAFVKRIYIIEKDANIDSALMSYVFNTFKSDKVTLLSGDIISVLLDKEEITTIMMNSLNEFLEIIESLEVDLLKDKFFNVNLFSCVEKSKEELIELQNKCKKDFNITLEFYIPYTDN